MSQSIRTETEIRELGVYLTGKVGKVLAAERALRAQYYDDKDGLARTGESSGSARTGHSDPTATVGCERAEGHGRDEVKSALVYVQNGLWRLSRELDRIEGPAEKVLKPPKEPPEPETGCRSCVRIKEFSDVYSEAPKSGLCRWCYRHRGDNGQMPPREAVLLMHTQSPRAAGLWMARNLQLSA